MKKNVIILLLTMATLSVFAKTPTGDRVYPAIETKFKKEFGSSVNVSWKIIQDISVASFTEQGETKDVYYYEDGEILGIGKNLKRDLLPESIKQLANSRFNGGIIQTVYEFKETGSPTQYFVTVVTPRYSVIVAANEFGHLEIRQKIKSRPFDVSMR